MGAAGALGVRSQATFTSAALDADEQLELEEATSELGAGCLETIGDEQPAGGLRRVRSWRPEAPLCLGPRSMRIGGSTSGSATGTSPSCFSPPGK